MLEMELCLGWVRCITAAPSWNVFAHLRESILQWPMILRQIFLVYQRTTPSMKRKRCDRVSFSRSPKVESNISLAGIHLRKNALWNLWRCFDPTSTALREKQIPTMLLSQKHKMSVLYLNQFKVGLS